MKKWAFTFFGLIISLICFGQFRFTPDFEVTLNNGQNDLTQAWDGGMNSPQFQTIDLNQDGQEDLAIYHRISRDITTYLLEEGTYVRSPEYDDVFPEDTRSLFILKDYDCDGRKDLFTSTSLGIRVYRNTTNDDGIDWSLASEFLTFDGGSNIQLAPSDIPGIADINGDGALDILTFRFGSANSIDLYLNTGNCGSLSFRRAERRWGDFEECGCNNFVFGQSCPVGGGGGLGGPEPEPYRHIGGKTILVFDADNDGDMDLISSDETCETLYFLENEGTAQEAKMTSIQDYPVANPAGFPFFPSAFLEDVDQDGLMDLVIATNADENIGNQIELTSHIKYYSNVGSNEVPNFISNEKFFQDQMVDLGENTYPTFADLDRDGDLDLIVGNKGLINENQLTASLFLFENIGNPINPSFELKNKDFLEFKSERYTFLKPQFVDLDNDQDLDLVYQATVSFGNSGLFYKENSGDFTFGPEIRLNIPTTSTDNPHFYDIDGDGDQDLLLGKQFGSLSLFLNEGELSFGAEIPSFAGIENNFERLNLNVFVADYDDNGIDDLLTTDLTGEIRAYRGPISLDFLATNPLSEIYMVNDQVGTSKLGIQNSITVADIFGTSKPAALLGTIKGGLLMLKNESENNSSTDDVLLRVRPNPASDTVLVLTNVNGTLDIYNTIGQRVISGIPVIPGTDLPIDISRLAAGTYIFKVISEQNQSKTAKVIVE